MTAEELEALKAKRSFGVSPAGSSQTSDLRPTALRTEKGSDLSDTDPFLLGESLLQVPMKDYSSFAQSTGMPPSTSTSTLGSMPT